MSESDHTRLRPAAPVEDPATRLRDPAPDPTLLRPDQQAGSTEIRADVTRQRSAESGPGASSPADQLSTDAEGRPVIKNRFVLTRQIGRGGMGIVYAAIDRRKQELRDPNPLVALKILNPEFRAHPDSLMALQREAGRAQSLAHPNIATVFDFDRDGDNVYLTMELLQGRPLDVVLKQARERGVPREEALSIIRGIAEALAYAHRKGIVHSDLKPGNVFVLEDGTTKLLDFGIARAVPSVAAKVADVFDAGSLGAYTEAYATREMVSGSDPHPADDMFALGVIAYELLGGAHPYQSQSIQRAQELGLKPVALKGLKHRQAKILARCIAFERDARPKDAKEFLDQFFGISSFQKSLIAASLIFALVAAFLWYRNYTDAGPAVSFEQLPLATQQLFESRMTEGDRAWSFFEHDGNSVALWDAIEQYAGAYDLHPRNRQAVKGLRRAADGLLNQAGIDVAQRREIAQSLQKRNEFLAKYSEVADAAK